MRQILTSNPHVRVCVFVSPTFSFQLPFADEDDQKFVDCAVCGSANFLITNDKHYPERYPVSESQSDQSRDIH